MSLARLHPLELRPQPSTKPPQDGRKADQAGADEQLDDVPGVRGRMREPHEQWASDREKEHNSTERRHEKDTGREGEQAAWRAWTKSKHDGRDDSGWI